MGILANARVSSFLPTQPRQLLGDDSFAFGFGGFHAQMTDMLLAKFAFHLFEHGKGAMAFNSYFGYW